MRCAVVIPTYNERENIEKLIEEILKLDFKCFIVVVDDNSPDGTGVILDEISKKYPVVKIIHRARKEGLGTAYVEGFKYVFGLGVEKIITMDADFSHDPKDIPLLLLESERHDIVIGSRYIAGGKIIGWAMWRKLLSQGGGIISRILLGLSIRDCTAGFKCYSRKFLKSLDLERISSQGYAFQVEMIFQAQREGFSIREIPIIFRERQKGKSKVGIKEILGFIQNILRLSLWRFKGIAKNKYTISQKVS